MPLGDIQGLPAAVRGCLFDMDGVLTKTAAVHAAAWKAAFDEFLRRRAEGTAGRFVEFDPKDDYDRYVDGRSRADGVCSFLKARGIELPDGHPSDPAGTASVQGIANRKNDLLLEKLATHGVEVFDDAISLVRAAARAGLRRAVVSASANTEQVLAAAGITGLFDARIDGVVAARDHMAGKPAPDMYLAGARALGLEPGQAAVFEDAIAGVEAGRAGGFALVVGVDRVGQADALLGHGADVVVSDLTELLRPTAPASPPR